MTQLNTFLAVVKTGSVTAAADDLFVTQPSVSAALSALAREVGVELTERDGRRLRLTAGGETYARYAADVVGLLDAGARAAREAADSSARELRIAAVNTAGEYLVSPLMRAFHARHPDVELTLDVGNRQRVFQQVADHEADVGIGGRPPNDGALVGRAFLANEIVLVTTPDDPLVGRPKVPVEELATRHWLLREEGSGTRTMIEEFLRRHDLRPKTHTLGSNGAIKQAAAIGVGVSLQSRHAVDLELKSGVLAAIDVRERLPRRDWYVLRAATGPVRPLVQSFIDFVVGDEGRHALPAAAGLPAASAAPRSREPLASRGRRRVQGEPKAP